MQTGKFTSLISWLNYRISKKLKLENRWNNFKYKD